MEVKINDFIEINYIGRFKDNNQIFDLTDAEVAKANGFNPKLSFKPVIICVGNGDVVKGLDDALIGKEVGKKYEIEVQVDLGFGRKNPKLMKLVSTNVFFKQKINPVPGLQVSVNDSMGTIRSVSGGRTLVDFNHPYSGHDLVYEVNVLRKIEDDLEKLNSFFDLHFNMKLGIKLEEGVAKIPLDLPEVVSKPLLEHLKKIIPTVKTFELKKPESTKSESKATTHKHEEHKSNSSSDTKDNNF